MSDHDEPQYRAYHQPDPEQVTLRETSDDEDGVFTVRMPIASTGEVRNEGDDPLTRDELSGMAEQIREESVGVFLDHGASALGGGGGMFGNRYSAVGKVGTWENPDLSDAQDEDGPALLEADARLMDPETLPAASGEVREALAALKSQVERNIPLSSSIGWREDENSPGGNDLMEASIVGIPADPRTVSDQTAAVARAAIEAGADREALLAELRAAVMGPESDRDMADEDTDTSEEHSEDTTDDEQNEERDAPDWAQELLEKQEQQTELLEDIHESTRPDDDEDEDDDEEENEGDDEDDEDDDEQDGEPSEEQDAETDDLQDALQTLRDGGYDVEQLDVPEDDAEEQDADDADEQREQTDDPAYDKYGLKPQ